MPAPISIIIPTLNARETLPQTLGTLMPGVSEGLIRELIIADGGSTDETSDIAEDAGAAWVTGTAGRGAQLAAGAEKASGDWLLFLHADSRLPENWPALVAAHLPNRDAPACFRLAFDQNTPLLGVLSGGANLRTRVLSLPYGDQGLLISRTLYARVGGFDIIPLMEDVAMARKLPRITVLPGSITTSAARYVQNGVLKQASRNLLRLIRYFLGASPEKLAQEYRR